MTLDEAKTLMARLQSAFGPQTDGGEGEGAEGGEIAAVDSLECSICLDPLTIEGTKLIRKCNHFFCGQCLDTLLKGQASGSCPMCRASFRLSDLVKSGEVMKYIEKSKEQEGSEGDNASSSSSPSSLAMVVENTNQAYTHAHEEDIDTTTTGCSPKIEALIEELTKMRESDPTAKAVVFSQFLGFLEWIEQRLTTEGYTFAKITGKQTAAQRKQQLSVFSLTVGGPQIMLISLKAGNCGINLTRASYVFLMDLWWNSAVEDQAADRVHRIGQTRPVLVTNNHLLHWVDHHNMFY